MGRRERHPENSILDAARTVVLERGVRAATIGAIAAAAEAPTGSIYHRFASVQELLARLWLRAARRSQTFSLGALRGEDPRPALVAAGLGTYDFCVAHPQDARLLALFSRADFLAAGLPAELDREMHELNDEVMVAVRDLCRRLFGRATREESDLVLAAAVDLPFGLARRYLEIGAQPPRARRDMVAVGVRALIAERGE